MLLCALFLLFTLPHTRIRKALFTKVSCIHTSRSSNSRPSKTFNTGPFAARVNAFKHPFEAWILLFLRVLTH